MSAQELDDIASRALASIILERTADAVHDQGANAADALQALAKDTSLPLEIAAGLLYATSWLAGVGDISAEDVYAASIALQPDPQDVDAGGEPPTPSPVDGEPVAVTPPAPILMEPLGDLDGQPCYLCDCRAIGVVDAVPCCFHHLEGWQGEEPCPSCLRRPGSTVDDPRVTT